MKSEIIEIVNQLRIKNSRSGLSDYDFSSAKIEIELLFKNNKK